MAILLSNTHPQNAMQLIQGALAQVYQPASKQAPLRQIDPAKASVAAHLPLYRLSVDALAKGTGLAPTVRAGSRFMVLVDNLVRAAIDLSTDPDGKTALEFQSIMDGPLVAGTKAAIDLAATGSGNSTAQIAAWECPALKLSLLAVLPDGATAPLLYVIAPPPAGLDAAKPYDAATLASLLKPMAIELLAQQNPSAAGSEMMGG